MNFPHTPRTASVKADAQVSAVLATGCPHSGWDMALPCLLEAGLNPASDHFSRWHEELFENAGIPDVFDVQRPLRPNGQMATRISQIIHERHPGPELLADARSLWLLEFWAEKLPDAKFLLFYTPAEIAIAHMLQSRSKAADLFNTWKLCNQQLVCFQRLHRRRAILLDANVASQQPASLVHACRRIGLNLQVPRAPRWRQSDLSILDRLTAHYLASIDDPSIELLRTELEAQSVPLGDNAHTFRPRPTELLEDYQQYKAAEKELKAQLENTRKLSQTLEISKQEVEQENELLLVQAHQVQEELEHYFLKYLEADRVALARDGIIKQLTETNDAQTARVVEQAKKITRLSTERDRYARLASKQKERITYLSKTIEKLKSNLAWKLMTPFRAIRDKREIKSQIKLLLLSELFDADWYLSTYQDVRNAGANPVVHYLKYGAKEKRNPSQSFNTSFYLENNHDVAASGMNPLVHFIRYGQAEGRECHP